MVRGGAPIQINWQDVFGSSSSPDREDGVCFASPSSAPPAPAKRPRVSGVERASSTTRTNQRFEGLRSQLDRRGGEGSPGARAVDVGRRPATSAAAKAAGSGPDARSAARDVYKFNKEDEEGGNVGRKYCLKSSPVLARNKNYGQLPMAKHTSRGHVVDKMHSSQLCSTPSSGNQRVDKMHSSQPCSTPFSGNQRRVHAISPESDHGKCQQNGNFSFSRLTKRRKEQPQDSSSVYSRKVQDVVLLDDEDMQTEGVVLLDDEDMQTEGEVNYEMSDKRNEPKIYYPSRADPEAVELTSSDINCLDPGAFLSSPVINYYIQNIKKTRLNREDCRDKFYIFNTYFYGKLEEALYRLGDFSKLRRWWKGVNIFHRAYIILPIHGTSHWSLVIICMPAKESMSGPIILHMDSLEMHHSTKILNTVGRYLEEEWRYLKKNHSLDTSVSEITWEDLPSNIQKERVQVPQQNNAYDCGIFMLYYIERFIRETPERFTIDKLDMFNCSWFKPEDASDLRRRIRELLLEEFENARLDDAMSDAAASNGSDIEDISPFAWDSLT